MPWAIFSKSSTPHLLLLDLILAKITNIFNKTELKMLVCFFDTFFTFSSCTFRVAEIRKYHFSKVTFHFLYQHQKPSLTQNPLIIKVAFLFLLQILSYYPLINIVTSKLWFTIFGIAKSQLLWNCSHLSLRLNVFLISYQFYNTDTHKKA